MSKEYRKYVREQQVKEDEQQSKFNIQGNLDIFTEKAKEAKIDIDRAVYCPFCLSHKKLSKFLITDVKGEVSTYKVKCRECNNTMLMRTLNSMSNMTDERIKAYAKWICEYRQGFWKKVKKDIWDKRLKRYGWSGIFWVEYKKLKATLMRPDNEYESEQEYERNRQEYLEEKEERFKRGEEYEE